MEIIDSTGKFKAIYQIGDSDNIYFGTIDNREVYATYYLPTGNLNKFYTKWDVEIDNAVNELLGRKDELLNPKSIEKFSKKEQFKAFITLTSIEIIDTSNLHTVCNIEKDSDYICITKTYVGDKELLEFINSLQ